MLTPKDATRILETGGAELEVKAINDGEYLKRVGNEIVSDTPSGSGGSGLTHPQVMARVSLRI